ncbi:MAG: tol-pal system protein YbgF [Deltaproteobacteria bacterium]|jgi:tol-pal system protein YbgF|nr:tol-pal system protein YbgF [Deltaproteobacteria bacterium]
MTARHALVLLPAFSLALLAACGGGGISVTSSNLEREVALLRQEVADLKDRGGSGGGGGAASSDLRLQVDNLRANVQRLNENVETASLGGMSISQQLNYMSARLDRLEKRAGLPVLSRDVVGPDPSLSSVPVVTAPPAVPPPGPPAALPPAAGPPVALPPAAGPPDPLPQAGAVLPGPPPVSGGEGAPPAAAAPPPAQASLYDQGKSLFDQKDYAAALTCFRDYLAAEPGGSQAAAAQYYIGESLYFQNQFEDAILEYQVLVSGYPKNNLVSAALLKQGLSFQAVGDNSSARILYQKVVREYPKSYSAGVARERLKTI